jgi:hypothetical protein
MDFTHIEGLDLVVALLINANPSKNFTIYGQVFFFSSIYIQEMTDSATGIISGVALLAHSQKQDWKVIWPILLAHTIKRLLYRYGIRKKKEELADLGRKHLSEVMDLVLVNQSRNWNSARYETFQDFMFSVIDSHLYNHFEKAPAKEHPTEDVKNSGAAQNAEDDAVYKDLRSQVFSELQNMGAQDDELLVFECMAEGIVKPSLIREELGLSPNDFRKAWRRLEPKLETVQMKFQSDE